MSWQQFLALWLPIFGTLVGSLLYVVGIRHINRENAKRIICDAAHNLGQLYEPYPEYRKRRPKRPSRKRIRDDTKRYAIIEARINQIDHTIEAYDALNLSDRRYFEAHGVDLGRMRDKLLGERALLTSDRILIRSTVERWRETWPNDLRIANIVH